MDVTVNKESLPAFLKKFGLQVDRVVKHTISESMVTSTTVHFASWTDAERAMRLLAKHLPHVNVSYRSDPCGMKPEMTNKYEIAGRVWRFSHSKKMGREWDVAFVLLIIFLILITARNSPNAEKDTTRTRAKAPGSKDACAVWEAQTLLSECEPIMGEESHEQK